MIVKDNFYNIDLEVQKIIEKHHIPGFTIGINHQNERVYDKGFGYRDANQKHKIDNDTICGIASITKSFTCVAIMKLQEMEKLSVNDQVIKFIPEFKTPNKQHTKKITIHHLMTHTAGLPPLPTGLLTMKESLEKDPSAKDYPGLDLLSAKGDAITTYDQLINHLSSSHYKILGEPGTSFSYSNDSYSLLGAIIERVSGLSFDDFVTENILKPAKMFNTVLTVRALEKMQNVTTLFATNKSGEVYPAPNWWESSINGAGGLKSTVNDLLTYANMFLNDGITNDTRILEVESVQSMIYPHVNVEPGTYYGYGFMIKPDFYGSTLIEHGGSSKGVASLLCMIPEKNIAVTALTNLAGVPTGDIVVGALNVVDGRPFKDDVSLLSEQSITVEQLADYEGSYTSEEGAQIEVKVTDDQLYIINNQVKQPLTYIGDDNFKGIVKSSEEIVQFIRSTKGDVERISYHYRQIFKD